MRRLLVRAAVLLVLVLTACPGPPPVQTVQLDAPIITPRALDFGALWLGQAATRTLTLQNPNRLSLEIALRTEAPFSGSTVLELAPGAERDVPLTFTPTVAGLAESSVTVTTSFSSETIEARGSAKAPPECRASGSCRVSTFDFDAGTCLERDADEGTDCRAALPCFRTAVCSRGACVGAQTTCDDADPCTLDVCTEAGCGHLDDSLSCPATSSLCLAPVCTAPSGCGTAPVVDGTPCGTRTCSTANVCLGGQCLTRPAPQTQACTDVVAGWPAGAGFVDGVGESARFPLSGGFAPASLSLAYRSDGLLFVCDGSTLRTVSPAGEVKTIAGVPGEFGLVNGFGRAARLNHAHVIGVDERDNAIIAEGGDRSRAQHTLVLRKVSAQGLVSSWVGARCSGTEPDGGVGAGACLGNAMAVGQTRAGDMLLATRTSWQAWRVDRIDRRGVVSFVAAYEVDDQQASWSWPVLGEHDAVHVCWSNSNGAEFDRGVDGGLLVGCRSKWSWEGLSLLRRTGEQRNFVVGTGPATDGPVSDAGLSWRDFPLAEDRDGGLAIADDRRFHLRRVEDGFIRTLAGPSPRTGLVDGRSALLSEAPRRLTARGGVLYFLDGPRVRAFEPGVGVSTVYEHARRCEALSVSAARVALSCGFEVLLLDDFALPPRRLRIPGFSVSAPFESIAVLPDGGVVLGTDRTWTLDESDGGWAELAPEWFPVLRNTSLGLVGLAGDYRRLVLPGPDGGTAIATFPTDFRAWDFAEAPDGTFIVVHQLENRVLRVTPFTSSTEVPFELSDQATSVAFTTDGGLFFGVPNAILRATLR